MIAGQWGELDDLLKQGWHWKGCDVISCARAHCFRYMKSACNCRFEVKVCKLFVHILPIRLITIIIIVLPNRLGLPVSSGKLQCSVVLMVSLSQ